MGGGMERIGMDSEPQRTEKRRVLLVDDDEGLRRVVAVTLGEEEFELLLASDGEEAVAVARQQHPELILLDVSMPRLNGFDVCRTLKCDPNTVGIKIIMLTAAALPADKARGREVGADAYFVKPFSPLALLDKVHSVLNM